ncbi:MAG TPA: hypothetical protein VJU84_19735 [Pyrinomonadaceae bacterium]|nr:hypothetical protein [Pyrinomonadaceae bacterium]
MSEVVSGNHTDSAADVLRRLRRFLLLLTISLFAGALVELWLVGHTEDVIQLVPFVLSVVGIVVSLLVFLRPSSGTIQVMRVWMAVVFLGTLLGVYFHIEGNVLFQREVDPSTTTSQLVWEGLGGGNPLLAPGILAIAALLAVAATYRYQPPD